MCRSSIRGIAGALPSTLVSAARVPSASAATIVVPPVTITQLSHTVSNGWVYDAVAFPDGSVESNGFIATIATGDTLSIRVQAPPGKKFVVHGGHGQPGAAEELFVDAYWTAGFDLVLRLAPYTLSFVNLNGPAPIVHPDLCAVSDHGLSIYAAFHFSVQGDFEFTTLAIQIIVAPPFTAVPQQYSSVQSQSTQ